MWSVRCLVLSFLCSLLSELCAVEPRAVLAVCFEFYVERWTAVTAVSIPVLCLLFEKLSGVVLGGYDCQQTLSPAQKLSHCTGSLTLQLSFAFLLEMHYLQWFLQLQRFASPGLSFAIFFCLQLILQIFVFELEF